MNRAEIAMHHICQSRYGIRFFVTDGPPKLKPLVCQDCPDGIEGFKKNSVFPLRSFSFIQGFRSRSQFILKFIFSLYLYSFDLHIWPLLLRKSSNNPP